MDNEGKLETSGTITSQSSEGDPEGYISTLLLPPNGSFPTLSSNRLNTMISALDGNQFVVIQRHSLIQPQVGSKEHSGRQTKTINNSVKVLEVKQSRSTGRGVKKWAPANTNTMNLESSIPGGDVEVLLIEDSSAGDELSAVHAQIEQEHQNNPNSNNEKDENVQKSLKSNTNKSGSTGKASVNLVEQVACFKCKFCMFLSLSQDAVASHVQREHSSQVPNDTNFSMQCPGCSNIFYSPKSLKVHLSEDHNVAHGELENIMKNFKSSGDGETNRASVLQTGTGPYQQQQIIVDEDDSAGNPDIQSSISKSFPQTQSSRAVGVIKKKAQERTEKVSVSRRGLDNFTKQSPPDESGKIRVRKMSSLEKSQQKITSQDFIEVDTSALESESSASVTAHVAEENSSEVHIVESQPDIQMDIEYDIDSMQILDIPLDQHSTQPQEQFIQELGDQNAENGRTLRSMVVDSDGRFCTVSASPTTCEAIIDEICQEEVLDNVLYVKSHICDDRDSPIMVCFAASPINTSDNEEDYDAQADDSYLGSENVNKDSENSGSERVILSSCTMDGSGLVGLDGKRLVKRGFVKRPQPKRDRGKKSKILKNRLNRSDLQEEPTIAGYKCNVYGCTVRLLSHDNMEYHQRCHVPNHVSENTLKVISGDNENVSEPKRGRIIHSKRIFSCPECSVGMNSWKVAKSHLWKYHSIDMELYSCDQCDYKTSSLSNLNNTHLKIHGPDKPFLCDVCGKGFKTTKQLRNHKSIHVRKETRGERCEVCGRTFHTSRMLRSHINTVHNKVRPYMCSECGHTAANRSSLKMHLRQHTGDRPYSCDQCEYTTADHNSLRRHKLRHSGDKPYKCPHCSYSCIQSSTFKIHIRSKHPGQDGDLMFSCKKCSFLTVNRDMYLAHVAEHDLAEACGVPFKPVRRPSGKKKAKRVKASDDNPTDEIPIYVSIAGGHEPEEMEPPNIENIVHHVSEAIVPGSNLHVLYNSISLSDSNMKDSVDENNSRDICVKDSTVQIAGEQSDLQLVAEVGNAEAILELPAEELKHKIRHEKVHH